MATAAGRITTLALVGRQVELLLEVLQLTHEVEVRRDVGFLDAHVLVGVLEGELLLVHEVGHGDGDGAGDASQAVYQDTDTVLTRLVCKDKKKAD